MGNRMSWRGILLVAFVGVLAAAGCCNSKARALADGFEAATEEIFREYEKYVIEGSPRPSFTESDKEIRRNSIRKARELIAEGKKE